MFAQIRGLEGNHPASKELAVLPTTCTTLPFALCPVRQRQESLCPFGGWQNRVRERKAFSKPQQQRWCHQTATVSAASITDNKDSGRDK